MRLKHGVLCAKVNLSMKKLLSIATLLGALTGAASAAPYVLPSPQPGALTPYDIQPVYSIEGLYGIAQDSEDPDTWGVRGSLSLYSDASSDVRHQFTLSVAGQWGSETNDAGEDVDLFLLPVTLGYDFNLEIVDSVFLYAGAKAGYAWADLEVDSDSKSTGGFTWSVGAGLKVQCSDSIYVKAGYEFGRTYFDDVRGKDEIYGQHVISVGVGCQF